MARNMGEMSLQLKNESRERQEIQNRIVGLVNDLLPVSDFQQAERRTHPEPCLNPKLKNVPPARAASSCEPPTGPSDRYTAFKSQLAKPARPILPGHRTPEQNKMNVRFRSSCYITG